MMDLVWAVLCSKSIIDQETNNVSLLDVIEQINVSPDVTLPLGVVNRFELVSLWTRGDTDRPDLGHARVMLRAPSGNITVLGEFDIDLTQYKRFRARVGMLGLQITELGVYSFDIEFSSQNTNRPKILARIPLEVRKDETVNETS